MLKAKVWVEEIAKNRWRESWPHCDSKSNGVTQTLKMTSRHPQPLRPCIKFEIIPQTGKNRKPRGGRLTKKTQRRPRQNSIQSFYCYLTLGRWRHLVLSRQIVEKTGGEKHWVLREIKGMDGDPHSLFYHSIVLSGWSWSQLDDKKWSRSSQMHCGQKPAEYPRPRREIESKTGHDSSFTFTFPANNWGSANWNKFSHCITFTHRLLMKGIYKEIF